MLSLNSIEPEVLSLILEYVDETSPKSTKAVACVNKYLNQITKFIAHRHKVVELQGSFESDSRAFKSISSWSKDDVILANIRTLTVKGWVEPTFDIYDEDEDENEYEDEDEDDDNDEDEDDQDLPQSKIKDISLSYSDSWHILATFLSQIGKLRRLDWNVSFPIPIIVLSAIEKHQRASTLRIFNFRRARAGLIGLDDIELRLARSSALTHFRYACTRHNISDGWNLSHELALRAVIASAPKLEYAGVILQTFGWGTTLGNSDETERYEPLFYKHNKPNASVMQLTLDGYDISKSTLDSWSTIVDLNTLQNVKFSRGMPTLDYFQSAATLLPNLKHLSLNLRPVKLRANDQEKAELVAAIQDYISTSSQLRTISLWSWMGIVSLQAVLDRHGATLESLQLREREDIGQEPRQVLELGDIRSIRSHCPKLREITFDLNRTHAKLRWDNDNNKQYYEELAKFEDLNMVQIYFDVGAAYLFHSAVIRNLHEYAYTDNSDADISDKEDDQDNPSTTMATTTTTTANSQSGQNPQHNSGNSTITTIRTSSLSPPAAPPPKKRRLTQRYIRPSRDTDLEPYTKKMWSTIFGHRAGGSRRLDVKVGEWESKAYPLGHRAGAVEHDLKRYMAVRPHERDDVGEPVVIVQKHKR